MSFSIMVSQSLWVMYLFVCPPTRFNPRKTTPPRTNPKLTSWPGIRSTVAGNALRPAQFFSKGMNVEAQYCHAASELGQSFQSLSPGRNRFGSPELSVKYLATFLYRLISHLVFLGFWISPTWTWNISSSLRLFVWSRSCSTRAISCLRR